MALPTEESSAVKPALDVSVILNALGKVYAAWVEMDPHDPSNAIAPTLFYSSYEPTIDIRHYLKRLVLDDCFEFDGDCILVLALIYVDRVAKTSTPKLINKLTIHRIVASAMLVSIKFLIDEIPEDFMALYAQRAGVQLGDLLLLERELLHRLEWKLAVPDHEWNCYVSELGFAA